MKQINSPRYKVGIRLPDWISGYVSRLFEGFLDFQRTGTSIELHLDQPSGGDIASFPITADWEGDGLLVYRYTKEEAEAWHKSGIFVVNLSAIVPEAPFHFARVTVDNQMIGALAYEHLSNLGVRDFAYMHESTRNYSEIRKESFQREISQRGGRFHCIEVPVSSYPIETRPQQIEECLREQLRSLPKPCGLLLKDDIAGVWTSQILRKLNIKCPDEIALLGVSDDIIFCHTTQPPLSSIPYPGRRIGFAAAKLLDSMIRNKEHRLGDWLTLPPEPVVARESTHNVILPDEIVSRALSFLKQECPKRPVAMNELYKVAGISRESLRQRFIKALGHSPKKESERLRCLAVTKCLIQTNNTLETIADELGFNGADTLCRFIKRYTGKTPAKIRKEHQATSI